jgi:hypothetical protein
VSFADVVMLSGMTLSGGILTFVMLSAVMLSIVILNFVMLSDIILSAAFLIVVTVCIIILFNSTECHYSQCLNTYCCYPEFNNAE